MKIVSNKQKIVLVKELNSSENDIMRAVENLRYFIASDVVECLSTQYGKTTVYNSLQNIEKKATMMTMNKKWFLSSFKYTEQPKIIEEKEVVNIVTRIYYTYRELGRINKRKNVINIHVMKANTLLAHMVLTKRISDDYIYNNNDIKEYVLEHSGISVKDYSSDAMILDKKSNTIYIVITPFGESKESLVKRINALYKAYNYPEILSNFQLVPIHYSNKKKEEFLYHLQIVKAMNKNKFDDNPMEVFTIKNFGLKNTYPLYEK